MADYCTVAEVKAQVEKAGSNADAVLAALITSASELIDRATNCKDGFVATGLMPRVFQGSGKRHQWIDRCIAISLVETRWPGETSYSPWAANDWLAGSNDPESRPDYNSLPYEWIAADLTGSMMYFPAGKFGLRGFRIDPDLAAATSIPTVRVTAQWGYSAAAPPTVKQATIIQTARWWKRGQSAWGDSVGSPELGQIMYRQQLDPDIRQLLKAYIIPALG